MEAQGQGKANVVRLCPRRATTGLIVSGWWRGSTWPTPVASIHIFLLISHLTLTFCVASLHLTPAPTPSITISPPLVASTITNSAPPTGATAFESRSNHSDTRRIAAALGVSLSIILALAFLLLLLPRMGCLPNFLVRIKSLRSGSSNRVVVVAPTGEFGDCASPCDHVDSKGSNNSYDHKDGHGGGVGDGKITKYRWVDIERVTTNFSVMIGCGGFSTVYLAHLLVPPSPTLGAIKIHSASGHLNRIFKQELDILIRLRHRNIIKLMGYCDDHEEGALVFEYVPNGSLQDQLHGDPKAQSSSSSAVIPWRKRVAIAFQLAQALEYLHEKCDPQIVHGDIKASNILLDHDLNCKLCDFGSAKMGFSSAVITSPSSTQTKKQLLMIMGSPGYTDPHYLRTGIASKKNDVYSYGVVLLELVTGKEAFSQESNLPLSSILEPVLGDSAQAAKLDQVVDPRLLTTGSACDVDLEEVRTMLFLSGLCLSQSPALRPSATQILNTIKQNIPSVPFLSSPR